MTRSSSAGISCGARVAVVTGRGVVGKDAPCGRITGVIGTHIVVIADYRRSRMTRSSAASVACRTRVSIATGGGVVGKDAARGRVTRVIGADIVVVADNRRSRMTRSSAARLAARPIFAVVTGRGVVGKDAPCGWITGVIGTHIVVVAHHG